MAKRKVKIIWTEQALFDLQLTYKFLAEKSQPAAFNLIQNIYDAIGTLEEGFIYLGQVEELLVNKYSEEYRHLIVGNHKVIYSIRKSGVYIESIFDCRQNPKRLKIRKKK